MRRREQVFIGCSQEGCTRKVPDTKFGRTHAIGWYFVRATDGTGHTVAWCPAHIPEFLVKLWAAQSHA